MILSELPEDFRTRWERAARLPPTRGYSKAWRWLTGIPRWVSCVLRHRTQRDGWKVYGQVRIALGHTWPKYLCRKCGVTITWPFEKD